MDTSVAEAYERLLVPTLNTRLAGEAVERAALLPGESILDVACGTGITIRLAMPRLNPGGRTTGVDIDPAMLAVASSLVSSGNGVTFEWRCASAQELPFEKGSFDAAFCLQGLQYLPDPAAAMTEMRRVMKAGGRMVSVVWTSLDDCKGQLALARALERRNIEATSIRKAYSFGDPG